MPAPVPVKVASEDDALALSREHLAPGLALAQKLSGLGAVEVRADGTEVVLSNGQRVLDFGSYGTTLFGHRPRSVVEAVSHQLNTLPTSSRALANNITPQFARRLVDLLDSPPLRRVWLGLNGTDSVEVALKLARLRTGRPRIVAVEGAFHGKTLGSLGATWSERYRTGLASVLPHVTHVSLDPDAVRIEVSHGDVAAFIFEPIQGEGGVFPLPPDLLREWCIDAHSAGAYVIADEVQVGFGRCGPVSLSVTDGLKPDAVLFGKALGGGVMPLSAMVCSDDLFKPMRADPFIHSTTFSGHPLSCAAGLAAIDLLLNLRADGERLGTDLASAFDVLVADHPTVFASARGRGLAWGLECTTIEAAGHIIGDLAPGGLLVSPCLGRPEVIRLLPPLTTTPQQLKRALTILHEAAASAEHALRR